MLEWLLRNMGYAVLDLDAVARALSARLLADFDVEVLDQRGTMDYLRTKYMRLVAEYGLPADSCAEVAGRAWAIMAQARGEPVGAEPEFNFYDD